MSVFDFSFPPCLSEMILFYSSCLTVRSNSISMEGETLVKKFIIRGSSVEPRLRELPSLKFTLIISIFERGEVGLPRP